MYQVTKRDGTAAKFEIGKISAAITKAFQALDKQFHPSVIDLLALRVTADFEPKIKDGRIAVEDIQDSVETVLSEAGFADVAKAYILYRKQREKVRNLNSTLLNYKDLVDNYLQINDWRVKENSTVTYSVGGLILSNSGAITANYWLSEIYEPGDRRRPPKRGDPPPRPVHAHRLLRRLVPEAAHPGGTGRHPRKDHLRPRQAPVHPVQPDGELPGHHAERVGRGSGLLLLRHLSGPLREGGQPNPEGGQAVHPVLRLWGEPPPAAGAPRLPSPTSPWTGRCPRTWRTCPPSWGAGRWTSPMGTARKRWTW